MLFTYSLYFAEKLDNAKYDRTMGRRYGAVKVALPKDLSEVNKQFASLGRIQLGSLQ